LFSKANDEGMNHAALLSVFVAEALEVAKNSGKSLDAVAVSAGPGSYTGLRIGVSTAKGICFGFDIPMIAVSTLEVMLVEVLKSITETNVVVCPMIDARRMEVYAALYNVEGKMMRDISADIITSDSYSDFLEDHKVYFVGNGSEKCKTTLTHPNAFFLDNVTPLAENMILFAIKAFEEKNFVDVAYFEPFYLKEFQTTTARSKV
jgi:tRNA threonylcarbamoyladenosine biosynthesis protein TsaB